MADLSSKQIQEFIDSQKDTMSDLFYRLENSQTRSNQQLNESINNLSKLLGDKLEKIKDFGSNTQKNDSADLSTLSKSLDKFSTQVEKLTEAQKNSDIKLSNNLSKFWDSAISVVKYIKDFSVDSVVAVENQLNFNRQLEVNGVMNTFAEIRESAAKSGISLDHLSEVCHKFRNVMVSLNAAGERGVLAFTEMGTAAYNQLQKDNITFAQSEVYEVEGAITESARKMGKLREMDHDEIVKQTVNMSKMIASLSEFAGINRSALISDLSEGPNMITTVGLSQLGATPDTIMKMMAVYKALKESGIDANAIAAFSSSVASGTPNDKLPTYFDPGTAMELVNLFREAAGSNNVNPNDLLELFINRIAQQSGYSDVNTIALENSILGSRELVLQQAKSEQQKLGQNWNQAQNVDENGKPLDRATERSETVKMLNIQADAARKLQEASNLARDSLLKIADSANKLGKTLGNAADIALFSTKKLHNLLYNESHIYDPSWKGEGFKQSDQNLSQAVNDIIASNNGRSKPSKGLLDWKDLDTAEAAGGLTALGMEVTGLVASAVKGIKDLRLAGAGGALTDVAATASRGVLGTVGRNVLPWVGTAFDAYNSYKVHTDPMSTTKDKYEADTNLGLNALATTAMLVGGPIGLIAGGLYLAGDSITELLTGRGISERIGGQVYDWTHDDSPQKLLDEYNEAFETNLKMAQQRETEKNEHEQVSGPVIDVVFLGDKLDQLNSTMVEVERNTRATNIY